MSNYDSWKLTSPYDNEFEYGGDGCPIDIRNVREFLEGVCKCVYENGDVAMLESCLDELCFMFDMEIPAGDPILEKKNQNRLIHWYLGYQRAQIESQRRG